MELPDHLHYEFEVNRGKIGLALGRALEGNHALAYYAWIHASSAFLSELGEHDPDSIMELAEVLADFIEDNMGLLCQNFDDEID